MHRSRYALVLLLAACGGKTAMSTTERATSDPVTAQDQVPGGGSGRGDAPKIDPTCQVFADGTYHLHQTRTRGDDTCGPAEQDTTTLVGAGPDEGWSCRNTGITGACRTATECEKVENNVLMTRKTVTDTTGETIEQTQAIRYTDSSTGKLLADCAFENTYKPL